MTTLRAMSTVLAFSIASTWALAQAHSQAYTDRPIRVIVPIAPGGVADIAARAFAGKVGEANPSHQVIVENRTGAAGITGADFVAKSAADGYTFLVGYHGVLSILQHMQKLPYDPESLVPVVNLITVPNILVVTPSLPVKNLQELIAYAKANPGKLTYASQGVGTTGHLGGELFKQAAGIDIVHVPYKGAAPAAQDLIGGHVHMMFDVVALARAHINEGRMRAIGIATRERSPALPDVPTLTEQGLPIELTAWFGLVAPAGTPQAAIDWINQAANKAFATPADRKRFTDTGATMPLGTPGDFATFIGAETKKFGEVIRKGDIKMQ